MTRRKKRSGGGSGSGSHRSGGSGGGRRRATGKNGCLRGGIVALCAAGIMGFALILGNPTLRALAGEALRHPKQAVRSVRPAAAWVMNYMADYVRPLARTYNAQRIPIKSTYKYGLDVSYCQERIKWDEVYIPLDSVRRMDVDFAYAKISQGTWRKDPTAARNLRQARKHGVRVGGYHYYDVGRKNPEAQAAWFLKHYTPEKGDLRPALDFEDERGSVREMREEALGWLRLVEQKTGVKPIIYTNLHLYKKVFGAKDFEGYDFWLAQWNTGVKPRHAAVWQFSDHGVVNGIRTPTDLDIIEERDWEKLQVK